DLPEMKSADERALLHSEWDPHEAGLPICVFVIGVRKPEGVFRWVVEPVIEDGRAVLHRDAATSWQSLDETGAVQLIEQVNAWYDALSPPPKSRGRQMTQSR